MKRVTILTLALVFLISFTFVATTQSSSEQMDSQELIKYMKERVVQIGISTTVHFRPFEWKKETVYNDEGEKVERWKKIKGDWQKEKQQFHCSGCIVYSGEKAPVGAKTKLYGHTIITTNFHCAVYLLEKKRKRIFGSSKWNAVKVYKKEDIKNIEKPGNWFTPVEDARPIGEQYITLSDKRPIIKYRKDQNFTIHGDLEFYDARLDLALIRLDNVYGLPEADFGTTPKVGQEVWIGGAPLAIPFSYDKGRVNQTGLDIQEGDDLNIGWQDQVKLDIAGAPGSSGSAIFDKSGKIRAILHGSFVYGRWGSVQGGQLALDAQNIKDFLRWNGYAYILED